MNGAAKQTRCQHIRLKSDSIRPMKKEQLEHAGRHDIKMYGFMRASPVEEDMRGVWRQRLQSGSMQKT